MRRRCEGGRDPERANATARRQLRGLIDAPTPQLFPASKYAHVALAMKNSDYPQTARIFNVVDADCLEALYRP